MTLEKFIEAWIKSDIEKMIRNYPNFETLRRRMENEPEVFKMKTNLCLDVECFYNKATRCKSPEYQKCRAKVTE